MEGINFSSKTDKINQTGMFAGITVYSLGSYTKSGAKAGDTILKDTSQIPENNSDEGKYHGYIVREWLGCQPSVIAEAGGAMAGFSY